MPVRSTYRVLLFAVAAVTLQACSDGPAAPLPGPEEKPIAGSLAAASIEGSGTVGTAVTTSPTVILLDTKGAPMRGAVVTFAVTTGGGSVGRASAVTDDAGAANAGVWTLGPTVGVNSLQASVAGVAPVTFTVHGTADAPASMVPHSTNAQSGVVGQLLTPAPAVVIRDRFGNPVPGVTVTFATGPGSGALSGAQALTDGSGVATANGWTLGSGAGVQTLQASVGAVSATIAVTARAGIAAALEMVSAGGQQGTAGVVVGSPPAVRVLDAFGNRLSGVTVTFAVASGGGSITGATQLSNAEGVAALGGWTLGTIAGSNSVTASVAGVAPVTFTANGNAGAPAKLDKLAGDAQTSTAGMQVAIAPSVRVRDNFDNAVPGATVTFTALNGGSITGGTATTNAAGVATVGGWKLSDAVGANALQANVAGLAQVTFTAQATADSPATLTAQSTNPTSGVVGQAVTPAPAVVVKDRYGNPVPGAAVTFTPGTGSGTIATAQATTDAAGVATAGEWTLGGSAGTHTLRATIGALSATISVTARAGNAASLEIVSGGSQQGTAGMVVATPPAVRVVDAFGNRLSGVTVTFAVASGGGTVTGATQVSNTEGVATVGGWTLGTVAGGNSMTASVSGAAAVSFTAHGNPGAPARLEKVAGDAQTALAGTQVSIAPSVRVRDSFDNVVPGATVTFTALNGGSISGGTATTNAVGVATLGGWTLSDAVGVQQLEAKAGTAAVTFTATATAANLPASLLPTTVVDQAAFVGAAVASRPAVRVLDAQSRPLAGIAVTFAVAAGGGAVTGANAVTAADGVATVGSWTLGTVPGANRLTATVTGLGAITFNAAASAGPAASLTKLGGDAQSAVVGAAVATAPTVRVRDAFGNDVAGVSVTFAVASGAGRVFGGTSVTNGQGVAAVGGWLLGSAAGTNTLTAAVAGTTPVTFSATATAAPPSAFDIQVRYVGSVAAAHRAAVDAAVARWRDVIRGDLVDVMTGAVDSAACGIAHPAFNEVVDDLLIYAQITAIDGEFGVLGSAGPCLIRSNNSLPAVGVMRFDAADLDRMAANGTLGDVILHEIGHILGIGTVWTDRFLLTGSGGPAPFFTGVSAAVYFQVAGGTLQSGSGVPVEGNSAGPGTANAHWRESTLRTELMTGWISPAGTPNPLSAITIASLADLGYVVNYAAANAYDVPTQSGFLMQAQQAGAEELREVPLPRPRRIN